MLPDFFYGVPPPSLSTLVRMVMSAAEEEDDGDGEPDSPVEINPEECQFCFGDFPGWTMAEMEDHWANHCLMLTECACGQVRTAAASTLVTRMKCRKLCTSVHFFLEQILGFPGEHFLNAHPRAVRAHFWKVRTAPPGFVFGSLQVIEIRQLPEHVVDPVCSRSSEARPGLMITGGCPGLASFDPTPPARDPKSSFSPRTFCRSFSVFLTKFCPKGAGKGIF